MSDASNQHEACRARIAELEQELEYVKRSLRQVTRERERAEIFALRSKQAILGTNRELEATVRDLERTMAELREAKTRAERASEAKGRFVATISHELRTPMNGILGTAELLSQSQLAPEDLEFVDIIRRSGKGLLSIINDVLDFTKAETGRIELENTRFDLHASLRAIADLVLNAARKKNVALELVIAPNVPRWVMGDPVRLRQVLLNLLDNAVKFTAQGFVRLEVGPVERASARLRFAVADSGIGIPENVRQAIFEPFVQADGSTTRKFGGSGLGLAICRHLVTLMGGAIELESEVGRGTCFHFEAALPAAEDQSSSLACTRVFSSHEVRLGMHVLVVDDNSVNRLIAVNMLRKLGCTSVSVESGRLAIEAAGREPFQAILMDCSMPEIDGFQATAAIRKLEHENRRTRIIAMTAHAMSGDRELCLNAGMDDYVTKPMQMAQLRAALLGESTSVVLETDVDSQRLPAG